MISDFTLIQITAESAGAPFTPEPAAKLVPSVSRLDLNRVAAIPKPILPASISSSSESDPLESFRRLSTRRLVVPSDSMEATCDEDASREWSTDVFEQSSVVALPSVREPQPSGDSFGSPSRRFSEAEGLEKRAKKKQYDEGQARRKSSNPSHMRLKGLPQKNGISFMDLPSTRGSRPVVERVRSAACCCSRHP